MGKISIRGNTFDLVDVVPLGYEVWNIPHIDGYIPFCRLKSVQPFPGGRDIEPETLRAIKVPDSTLIEKILYKKMRDPNEIRAFIWKEKHLSEKEKEKTFSIVMDIIRICIKAKNLKERKGKMNQEYIRCLRDEMVGNIYPHFKGGRYIVSDIAINSETEEPMVIYRNFDDPKLVWCRPLSMFQSEVDHEKYPDVKQKLRFEKN